MGSLRPPVLPGTGDLAPAALALASAEEAAPALPSAQPSQPSLLLAQIARRQQERQQGTAAPNGPPAGPPAALLPVQPPPAAPAGGLPAAYALEGHAAGPSTATVAAAATAAAATAAADLPPSSEALVWGDEAWGPGGGSAFAGGGPSSSQFSRQLSVDPLAIESAESLSDLTLQELAPGTIDPDLLLTAPDRAAALLDCTTPSLAVPSPTLPAPFGMPHAGAAFAGAAPAAAAAVPSGVTPLAALPSTILGLLGLQQQAGAAAAAGAAGPGVPPAATAPAPAVPPGFRHPPLLPPQQRAGVQPASPAGLDGPAFSAQAASTTGASAGSSAVPRRAGSGGSEAQKAAQRRYLQRKKEKMLAMEEQIELLAEELAAARLANQCAQVKGDAYQMMLQYKQEMLAALRQGQQVEASPGTNLSPETLLYLEAWNAGGALSPNIVMRYRPDGYTDNLDERGLPTHAPPFDRILNDYADIVNKWRQVLTAAEAGGQRVLEEVGAAKLSMQIPPLLERLRELRDDRPPWRHLVLDEEDGEMDVSWAAQGAASSEGCAAATETSQSPLGHSSQGSPGDMGRASSAAAQALSVSSSGGLSVGSQGSGVSQAESSSSGNSSGRRMRRYLKEAGQQGTGPHAVHNGGLLVKSKERYFYFQEEEATLGASCLQRVGSLLWQQAVLFPETMMRVFASRLDTGERCDGQVPELWERVMEELALRPEQLQLMVVLHGEYQATVAKVAERRNEATAQLQQLHAELARVAMGAGPAQETSRLNLATRDCAAQLERCVHEDHAAEVKFTAVVLRMLDFPLQFAQIFVSSWPYLPKAVALATIAARLLKEQAQSKDD